MSVGQTLLTNLFNSTYTPTRNPDLFGVNSKGIPVDKDGNPTTVYNKPNFLQRVLSPTADDFNNLNAKFSSNDIENQQQQAFKLNNARSLIASQPSQNDPYLHAFDNVTSLSNGDSGPVDQQGMARNAWASSLVNPDVSPSYSQAQVSSQGGLNTGLIGNTGGNVAKAANTITSGQVQNAPAQVQLDTGQLELANQQLKGELGRQATTEEIKNRAQSNQLKQLALEHTQLGTYQSIADSDSTYAPLIHKASNITDLYNAQNNAPVYNTPFAGKVDLSTGGVILGKHLSPEMMAAINMGAKIPGLNGSQPRMINVGGKQIPAPDIQPQEVNPLSQANATPGTISTNQPASSLTQGVNPNGPVANPPPLHVQAMSNMLPSDRLSDAENVMMNMGLLDNNELYKGKGRDTRRITDSQEESLIKARLPLLMKKAQNPIMKPSERALIGNIANLFE